MAFLSAAILERDDDPDDEDDDCDVDEVDVLILFDFAVSFGADATAGDRVGRNIRRLICSRIRIK